MGAVELWAFGGGSGCHINVIDQAGGPNSGPIERQVNVDFVRFQYLAWTVRDIDDDGRL
jgi:hypothetical protein